LGRGKSKVSQRWCGIADTEPLCNAIRKSGSVV
jgi:hypothetical protein